jgi:hypothetical protein
MEVAAVEVLDQGDLHDFVVGHVEFDARHLGKPGLERRTEAALPCNDPEPPVGHRANEQRFEDALGLDGLLQLLEVAHAAARLLGIGLDLFDGDMASERGAEPLG